MTQLTRPFEGLKIVELASVLAGPLVGSFFSELGAQVIKIENSLSNGDVTRTWKLSIENEKLNTSAYYHCSNFGKKIVMLDFTNKDDYEKAIFYILQADIVITNFQKKTAEKLKIDVKTLSQLKKDLILVQLNAFEYDDPRAGYDIVMQAEAGFIAMNGYKNALAKMPVAMIDILAAHQMKEAILVALISKAKGETGCIIHVSLFHSAISALVNQATNFLMEGYIAEPMGTLHPNIAPYGEMSTTLDGHLIIWAIGSDLQFEKLMNYFKISIQDFPQFATNKKRVLNRIELQSLLNEACKKFTYSQISSYCDQASIPYGNVKTIDKVLSSPDAQSMIKSNDISQMDKGKYISNVAFKIDFND